MGLLFRGDGIVKMKLKDNLRFNLRSNLTLALGRFSKLAYDPWDSGAQDREKIKEKINVDGDTLLETYNCNGTQALLIDHKGDLVVAFRGTEQNGVDILTDLKCRLKAGTHRGFLDAWNSVSYELIADLKRHRRYDQKLFCTGHSLGGALAVLAGEHLGADLVVTFGSPRVYSRQLRQDVPMLRYENGWDIVPYVPFLTWGYRHVGTRRHLSSGRWFRIFSDHKIDEYLRGLHDERL